MVHDFVAIAFVDLPVDLLTVLRAVICFLALADLNSARISANATQIWLVDAIHQHPAVVLILSEVKLWNEIHI